jgi:hypothetical protein
VRHGGRQFSYVRPTIATTRVSHQSPVTLHYRRTARAACLAAMALQRTGEVVYHGCVVWRYFLYLCKPNQKFRKLSPCAALRRYL